MTPDFLLVGHIVKDIVPEGWRPGGGVFYAAVQAQKLGLKVAAVTRCAADLDPQSVLSDVDWHVVPDEKSTTFENWHEEGVRRQRVLARARPLRLDDIPEEWRDARLVLLMPVFHDVRPDLPHQLRRPGRILGLAAQGWLRSLEGEQVLPGRVEPDPEWLDGDVVFVSAEDVEEPEKVAVWQERVPIVILTRGRAGCTVWEQNRHDLAAFEALEVDPTGAGDVFAAAFLIRLSETGDALVAGRFASAAAALSLREPGTDSVAGADEIQRLASAVPASLQ